MKKFFLLAAITIIATQIYAQKNLKFAAPVQQNNFASLTSYDSLRNFLTAISQKSSPVVEQLAATKEGRNIFVVKISSSKKFGSDDKKLRVLLFAQQHGDEPSGKEALSILIAKCASGEMDAVLKNIDLMIIPQMNPDGSELRTRRNADKFDLNRNHVLLTQPEIKALHDVFFQWKPEVTMDIHEFGSFSSSWSDSGFIKAGDVQLGMLTNANTPDEFRKFQHDVVFPEISAAMKSAGYYFHEYIVGSPQSRIRHSTTEINDGRQSFGILGTISFIQEGRQWKTVEDSLKRRTLSQLASIQALLKTCATNSTKIKKLVAAERKRLIERSIESSVVVRMDHVASEKTLKIPVQRFSDFSFTEWNVKPYHSVVKPLLSVALPQGYFIAQEHASIIELLKRHRVVMEQLRSEQTIDVEAYEQIGSGFQVIEEDSIPTLAVRAVKKSIQVKKGDYIISPNQLHGMFLGIVLEPESFWGLVKYDEFAWIRTMKEFPVYRLLPSVL